MNKMHMAENSKPVTTHLFTDGFKSTEYFSENNRFYG